jgi:hypothetical protein
MSSAFGELRHEPTPKRIRAALGDQPVVGGNVAVLLLS